jgi:hypothetical protein
VFTVDMTSLQKAAWLLQRSRAGDPTSAYNLGLYYHDRPVTPFFSLFVSSNFLKSLN